MILTEIKSTLRKLSTQNFGTQFMKIASGDYEKLWDLAQYILHDSHSTDSLQDIENTVSEMLGLLRNIKAYNNQ